MAQNPQGRRCESTWDFSFPFTTYVPLGFRSVSDFHPSYLYLITPINQEMVICIVINNQNVKKKPTPELTALKNHHK